MKLKMPEDGGIICEFISILFASSLIVLILFLFATLASCSKKEAPRPRYPAPVSGPIFVPKQPANRPASKPKKAPSKAPDRKTEDFGAKG